MPGLDLSQLSNNWKKLQKTLQSEKKQQPQGHGLKRKRLDKNVKAATNGHKKTKFSESNLTTLSKSRRMGYGSSKPEEPQPKPQDQRNLAQHHEISKEDISAAYGTPHFALREHIDTINSGLHSTNKAGKYISLDCEMVGTGPPPHSDNVLARASVVNFHGDQLYDSYVLPPPGVEVKDYRTFASGIKPAHLAKNYARAFSDVQKDIAALLEGRILVGHALRNDLQALLLSHPKRDQRDTSRYPKFRVASGGKPPALRNLAKAELGMSIQGGEHSSIEDARAAMVLFRKEKGGFEEENRRTFGSRRTKVEVKRDGNVKVNGVTHDDGAEEEDGSGDPDLLSGEEGEEALSGREVATNGAQHPKAKKKRKKKKRTKRK